VPAHGLTALFTHTGLGSDDDLEDIESIDVLLAVAAKSNLSF